MCCFVILSSGNKKLFCSDPLTPLIMIRIVHDIDKLFALIIIFNTKSHSNFCFSLSTLKKKFLILSSSTFSFFICVRYRFAFTEKIIFSGLAFFQSKSFWRRKSVKPIIYFDCSKKFSVTRKHPGIFYLIGVKISLPVFIIRTVRSYVNFIVDHFCYKSSPVFGE